MDDAHSLVSIAKDLKAKKAILVVDDCPDLLFLNRMILEMEDYNVYTASSGEEAFRILSEISKPDLILLDMQMEGMSGPEFLEIFEKQNPDIFAQVPVVFLSARAVVPESKAKGFIRKPIDTDRFLKAVRGYIYAFTGLENPHEPAARA